MYRGLLLTIMKEINQDNLFVKSGNLFNFFFMYEKYLVNL